MQNKGIVIQAIKDNFHVLINDEIIVCAASQKIKTHNKIVCGDKVIVDLENNYITKTLKRKNFIIRPKIANVDKVFITTSFKEPDLATLLIDKMILFYSHYQVTPILIFTKKDLIAQGEYSLIINDYKKAGYKILESNQLDIDINFFQKEIKGFVSMFAGQSGVGKSTILNQLDSKLELQTNEISKALNRGKHTTTKNTLYQLFGGLICDTPGFSSIQQTALKPIHLANQFLDFKNYAKECKFNNCIHINEIKCRVKEEVGKMISKQRYQNYVKILNSIQGDKKWQ